MSETMHAELRDEAGRPALRFERTLAHPPERIWRALTDDVELSDWHPTPFKLEPTVGGAVSFISTNAAPPMPDGTVTACEPPRLLAHTWGDDSLRWEIEPDPRGSRLTLTHTFDDRFKAARDAAGWHLCLDALSATLDRAVTTAPEEADYPPAGWRELNGEYEQRFGIAPEQATPPPSR
jgi:uncharacterized protein YndB with AHSA1/START domain